MSVTLKIDPHVEGPVTFPSLDSAMQRAVEVAVKFRRKVDVILEIGKEEGKPRTFIVGTVRGNKFFPTGASIYGEIEKYMEEA